MEKRSGEMDRPKRVRATATRTPKVIPWAARRRAPLRSPAPRALAMSDVVPVERPFPTAMMMKNTGKERERAARAWVEIRPPYRVSTTLNMVLKKKPMLAGMAIRRISVGMGSVVSGLCMGGYLNCAAPRRAIHSRRRRNPHYARDAVAGYYQLQPTEGFSSRRRFPHGCKTWSF